MKRSIRVLPVLVVLLLSIIAMNVSAFAATKLTAPANFKITNRGGTRCEFSWSAVTDASGYWLYTDAQTGPNTVVRTTLANTTSTIISVDVTFNAINRVYVVAKSPDGTAYDSNPAGPIVVECDASAPSTPSNFRYDGNTLTDTSVKLMWNASTDNIGVKGYFIYKDGLFVDQTTSTSYTVTGLSPYSTYNFTVVAFDTNNTSPESSVCVVRTKLSAPVLGASGISGASIGLQWSNSYGADNYYVYADVQEGSTVTRIDVGYFATNSYSYIMDINNDKYTFYVVARKGSDNLISSAPSNPLTVIN